MTGCIWLYVRRITGSPPEKSLRIKRIGWVLPDAEQMYNRTPRSVY